MATTRKTTAAPPTPETAAPIGDVNAPLVGASDAPAPELPEIVDGPPQFYPTPPGPHYVRIHSDVTIKAPPYEGFRFKMVKNFKMRIWDDIRGGANFEVQCRALAQIMLHHYDWCDDEGNVLPPIEDDPLKFINELPMDLYDNLLKAILEDAHRLPDFPTTTGRR